MMIDWGSWIEMTPGNLPNWVKIDDLINYRYDNITGAAEDFRLPVDHWAYKPIAAGFTPWAGGNEPPSDWDSSPCMLRNGMVNQRDRTNVYDWRHTGHNMSPDHEIIGYRRKSADVGSPLDPRMKEALQHAQRLFNTLLDKHFPQSQTLAANDLLTVIDQIDNLTTGLTRVEGQEWHNGLHVITVERCIEVVMVNTVSHEALKKLLPPDPVETLAEELRQAAYRVSETALVPPPSPADMIRFKRVAAYVLEKRS